MSWRFHFLPGNLESSPAKMNLMMGLRQWTCGPLFFPAPIPLNYLCPMAMAKQGPIGVFDSGYGGLTVLKELVNRLPQYDYTYLGDNARAPYGNRSFETVYRYTLQCVEWLFRRAVPW
jgi:hypothetical protein